LADRSGKRVVVYGQQEVMHDLFEAAKQLEVPIIFNVNDVALHDLATKPYITWREHKLLERLDCDFVAGCDGFHGISRDSIPTDARTSFERVYPFGWLGILADVPPAHQELIYANHLRGFALASMRSRTRSRYYLQCDLHDRIEDWPDERFWDELILRLGPQVHVTTGPSFEKSITPLRSLVIEPMRYGSLFLLGDAAHIVPPTGAKGLNLAVSDAVMLSESLGAYYRCGKQTALDSYSNRALARVWKAERFSWWFTGLTHRFPETDAFSRKMQIAELAYLRQSEALQTAFSENYVGLPLN